MSTDEIEVKDNTAESISQDVKLLEPDRPKTYRKYYQCFVLLIATASILGQGLAAGSAGFILPQIWDKTSGDSIHVSREIGAWFGNIMPMGGGVGSIICGYQSSFLGRKKSLTIGNLIMSVGFLIIALGPTFPFLMVGRIMTGVAYGMLMVDVPLYCAEIAQPTIRPIALTMFMVFNTSGIALSYQFGAVLPWRQAIWVEVGLTAVTGISVFLFCPESHVWLLLKQREELARSQLAKMRGNLAVANQEIDKIAAARASQQQVQTGQFRDLLMNPTFRRPFVTSLALRMLGLDWSGFFNLGTNLVHIKQQSESPVDPYAAAAWLTLMRLPFTLMMLTYISRVKIKSIYATTSSLVTLGSLAVAIRLYLGMEGTTSLMGEDVALWMAVAGKVMMYAGFSLGQAQVCFTIPGELMPAKHRSFGLGLLNFIHGFTIFGSLQAMTYIEIEAGLETVFLITTVCTLASTLLVARFVPETRGKTLVEIEEYYKQFVKTRIPDSLSDNSANAPDTA